MGWTKLISFIIIASASIFAIILFLFFDYFFGKNFSIKVTLPIQLTFEEKPYVKLESGWYELKRNFYGSDQFGNSIIPVRTDAFGFRQALSKSENLKSKVIFLGDSFTYGINLPFEKTFAGIFAEQTKIKILNAGVASYSPTPYLYQYKKALKENFEGFLFK